MPLYFKGDIGMLKFKLQSGKILEMTLAPVETALELLRVFTIECKNAGLDLKIATEDTIGDLIGRNTEALLNICSSKEALEAIKACSERNLYDKQRFSMSIFEDEKARGDFIPVMVVTALENLRPFFPNLRIIFETLEAGFLA